jgi:hypothetical protein
MYATAERITRGHPISLRASWSVCTAKFEIRNLYAKNIMFACSLPMSTSTWRSEHRNGPGGYMSGQLKSENRKNIEKPPLKEAIIQQKDPQSSHHIQPSPRKILVLYTRLFYNTRKTLKTSNQDPPRSTRPSRIAVHT